MEGRQCASIVREKVNEWRGDWSIVREVGGGEKVCKYSEGRGW